MQNAITTLRIQNFKSIKDVTLTPRRVNIIIGEPNVGKSNILEAISLLGGMFFDKADGRFMDGQIRYETIRNLFYDNDWSQEITVTGEKIGETRLRKQNDDVVAVFGNGLKRIAKQENNLASAFSEAISLQNFWFERDISGNKEPIVDFNQINQYFALLNKQGLPVKADWGSISSSLRVKKYTFQKQTAHGNSYNYSFLRPPYGDNLMEVIQTAPSAFRREIGAFFTQNGYNLTLRTEEQKLEVTKTVDGLTTSIPYALIADTLQRIVFYLAAIGSNTESVLLLEEPEAHSFPEYVAQLGQTIVESDTNQFFIATHSPYLITEILEEMVPNNKAIADLAMFAVYYEDYQTKVYQLTEQEITAVRSDGLDVFFNMGRFVPQV